MSDPVRRVLRDTGEDLLEVLSQRLAPTDLQSLLMEVYRKRAEDVKPSQLLKQHEENRFVRPSIVSPITLLEFDRLAFSLAKAQFEPIELAPLSPLGTTASLTSVSQNNVVPTARNTDVLSDPTNVMALECAARRKRLSDKGERLRLCSSARVVRAQSLPQPKSWAHFKLFALCSSGRDEGSHRFEVEELAEHIDFYIRLLAALREQNYAIGKVRIAISNFGDWDLAYETVLERLAQWQPSVTFVPYQDRQSGRGYYYPLCFQIYVEDQEGTEQFLVDGGATNWTQQLLSNKKERFLISGIGTERLCSLFAPEAKTEWKD
jgi:hypothetical protein